MSNEKEYEVILPLASEIRNDEILKPNMPIKQAVYEAEDLSSWCSKDQEALIEVGVPETHFTNLNLAAGALRHAESIWNDDDDSRKEAELKWRETEPLAYDVLEELVHICFFVYDEDQSLLNKVREIASGNSDADLIQGLNDLAVIGKNHPHPLLKVELLNKASQYSSELGDIRATANSEKFEATESLMNRNKIYTLLKRYTDDIRRSGKFVFWRDEDRLIGYSSKYHRLKNKRHRANADAASGI
ncbi:hypothetical protein [Carboxylicivirga marina]|uniref:Uncharacterized protein n=1 Tax=Carboxylicivirga marina TaxID=2800988 RepID=A0ABS1HJB3_9BACT|nr:hypothetical protein [Carboxylicivirga marina]MBK3517666.1 hypothetical protein [Carboxylicivirga marina]